MGLIGKLDGHIFGKGAKDKEITMNDIAKCKTGSFTMRFIGLVQTAIKKREFVTDSTVAKFMEDHFGHLEEISGKFAEAVTTHEPPSQEETHIWKKDREMAKKMTKVFTRAAVSLPSDNQELFGVQTLKVLGALNQYDPSDLLRAAAYEKAAGSPKGEDIKGHFVDFIKKNSIEVRNEQELNAAYNDFKKNRLENPQNFTHYAFDRCLSEYHEAENDLLEQGRPNIAKFQEMSIIELLNVNEIKSPRSQLKEKLKEILSSSDFGARRADLEALYLNPGVAPILKEIAEKMRMPEAEFMKDFLNLKHLPNEQKEVKIQEMMTSYVNSGAPLEINTTFVIASRLASKHDSVEDFAPSYHHMQDQFINNASQYQQQHPQIIEGIIDQWKGSFVL